MTEDMRERGVQSKWNELFVVETEGGEWIDMAGEGGWSAFSLLSEAEEVLEQEDEPCKIVRFVRQAALSSAGTSGTADARLSAMLYRSLERLSLAIAACAHIGFEESSPTTNEHHASIWLDLNEAQKDAKLKLKHYAQFVRGDSL